MENKERRSGKVWDKLKKNKYVLIVVLAGVFLLLLPTGGKQSSGNQPAPGDTAGESVTYAGDFSLSEQEERIAQALSEIDGAGRVTVVLTLKSSEELVIAKNTEDANKTAKDGETSAERSETAVIVSAGSQNQTPVKLKYIYPEYQGALVVAEGADSATVKLELTRAVAGLTGLGADKITITKMKNS